MAEPQNRGPTGYPFAVADKVLCAWDLDHAGRTIEYLDGLDVEHFGAIARALGSQLESDDALAVSVALRMHYVHGIEALMSLLGAYVQGPEAVPAWIARCSTENLLEVVRRLRSGAPILTQNGLQNISIDDLAKHVHCRAWVDDNGSIPTSARFARLWHRLANELLDDHVRAEFNALKHGNRITPGGFSLAIGEETLPGVPAAPEAMVSLGSSRFGTTFHVSEQPGGAKHHLRMRRTSVNWSPVHLANRLILISMSISNVVGAFRCDLGADPTTVLFRRPEDPGVFDEVWAESVGPRRSSIDVAVQVVPSDEISAEELREQLRARGPADGSGPAASESEP